MTSRSLEPALAHPTQPDYTGRHQPCERPMSEEQGGLPSQKPSTPFRTVYHVAAIHHWRVIVDEQLPLLLGNRNIADLHVTIATDTDAHEQAVVALFRDIIARNAAAISWHWQRTPLKALEHATMSVVDQLARQDEKPLLYFHCKGVRYSPPLRNHEVFRQYVNRLVAQADYWAEFLVRSEFDACGPLLYLDEPSGIRLFAGNFWIAKSSYLRSLMPYDQFVSNPGRGRLPWDRHLAEMAVNRMGQMRPHAIDGTSLTNKTFNAYMAALLGSGVNLLGNHGANFTHPRR